MIGRSSDVSHAIQHFDALTSQFLQDGPDRFLRTPAAQGEPPAIARQRAGDAETDAARPTGDDGDAWIRHATGPIE